MRVERYSFKSEPIDIGNEHITINDQKAKDFYHEYMHHACQTYIELSWTVKCIHWNMLHEKVKEIVDKCPTMYFDGPSWIVSTAPWKVAKYGEWTCVSKKTRWLLKKEYTNGVRNRQEETSSMSSIQSEQSSFNGKTA
jgi:hypothetical protein